MKRVGRVILVVLIALGLGGCGDWQQQQDRQEQNRQPSRQQANNESTQQQAFEKVRQPAVAGMFYPANQKELAEEVDQFLEDVESEPLKNLRGLICPHAGYRFSGKTAAFGYKQLVGRKIHTVIILAPTHYAMFAGASIPDVDAYRTPLGTIPLSPKAAELAKLKPFVVNPSCQVSRPGWWRQAPKELPPFGEDTPHTWEHSLEVQLPLLQRTLKDFSIVPVVFGKVDPEAVARALLKVLDNKTIVVASSDLSHYHPYALAKELDTQCVKAICSLDIKRMKQQEACGKDPILSLMYIAKKKGWKAKLLDYRNSGDTSGDKSGVVGYAAIVFYDPRGESDTPKTPKPAGQNEFSPGQRKFLLELARKTISRVVEGGDPPVSADVPKKLTQRRAVFVTLTKGSRLRGCIGSIFPQRPLCQAVIHSAANAAVADTRFPPVQPDELDQIEIEVSVLTVPKQLHFSSPEELLNKLRPNVDGVVLRVGQHQATYLPQVWDQITDKRDFLGHLAQKAGLAKPDWMSEKAAVLVYQVEAFKESEIAN